MDKSEIIRIWLREKIDANFDFSNQAQRKQAIQDFCVSETGKKNGLSWSKHQTLFLAQLKKVCKEKGLDPTIYGLARPKVKFQNTSKNIDSTISPKPKSVRQQASQNTTPQGGAPIQQAPQGQAIPAQPTEEQIEVTIDLVKVTWKSLVGFVRMKYPEFGELTEDELSGLGTAWLPIFREYLQAGWMKWGVPILVTAGVFLPRMARIKAAKEGKEEIKDPIDKKKDEKKDTKIDKDSEEYKSFEKWQAEHKRK